MRLHRVFHYIFLLAIIGLASSACEAQELDELNELEDRWIQKIEYSGGFKVKQIYMTGGGVETKFQGFAGQGVAVRDNIMYRLYDSGLCQTYDITDFANPVKVASFGLGSRQSSNHSNCGQFYVDENGDSFLYVSGLKGGKTFVEQITETGATLVQTITLPQMEFLNRTATLNAVCSDDGYLWYFGSGGDKLLFAKARKPDLSEGDVTLGEDDFLDFWSVDGYVYKSDVWQGGKVYGNLLFFLFGAKGSNAHLRVYDTRAHEEIMDIDLSSVVRNEPEDCELISKGILVVTNGGSNYYLIRPE